MDSLVWLTRNRYFASYVDWTKFEMGARMCTACPDPTSLDRNDESDEVPVGGYNVRPEGEKIPSKTDRPPPRRPQAFLASPEGHGGAALQSDGTTVRPRSPSVAVTSPSSPLLTGDAAAMSSDQPMRLDEQGVMPELLASKPQKLKATKSAEKKAPKQIFVSSRSPVETSYGRWAEARTSQKERKPEYRRKSSPIVRVSNATVSIVPEAGRTRPPRRYIEREAHDLAVQMALAEAERRDAEAYSKAHAEEDRAREQMHTGEVDEPRNATIQLRRNGSGRPRRALSFVPSPELSHKVNPVNE